MIDPRELRKGSKVISTTHNLMNATVAGFTPSDIVFFKEVSGFDMIWKLNPIQITPEILERIIYPPYLSQYKVVYNKEYYEKNGKAVYWLTLGDDAESRTIQVVYLHLLQNLYFALTGEELNVQL